MRERWARLARIDPELLGAVRHRSAKAQIHLTVIRARAALVSTRTALVNAARGLTKSYGARLRKCGTGQMNRKVDYQVAAPAELRTPNLHRAKNRSTKSADGRMATGAARLERKEPKGGRKNILDSYRPSHGRTLTQLPAKSDSVEFLRRLIACGVRNRN